MKLKYLDDRKKFNRVKKDIVTMVFVDTGDREEVEKASSNDTFIHNDKEYVINRKLWAKDTCFYHSGYVEPLTMDWSVKGKGQYAVTTDRFKALYHNKVLAMMMYIMEKNMITYILIAVIVAAALGLLNAYYTVQIYQILKEFGQVAVEQGVMIK